MLSFENLNQVSKSYTKEGGAVRGQNYHGIKFRSSVSKKGETIERLIYSDSVISKLSLDNNGFIEFTNKDSEGVIKEVFFALVQDTNDACKLLKRTGKSKNDKKVFSSTAPIVIADLKEAGVLQSVSGNQFLQLEQVEIPNTPEWIIGMYKVVVDITVVAGEEDEDEESSVAADTDSDF